MTRLNRLWIPLSIGLAILGVAVIATAVRKRPQSVPRQEPVAIKPKANPGYYVAPKDPGKPLEPAEDSKAWSDAILKSHFQIFRTAVATGKNRTRDAYLPVLRKDLEKAMILANEDLARAKTEQDIDIAKRVIEYLGGQRD